MSLRDEPFFSRVKTTFRSIAVILAFLQAWAYRFYIEPDGVNYLDIARAYTRRDWTNALNSYWSPLYSWLLASMQWIFHPSPYWESTSLHLLNFALSLFAPAGFEFFFTRSLSLSKSLYPQAVEDEGLPEWAWWTLGYTVFLICTLRLITLGNDNPDIALAALIFLPPELLIDLAQSGRSTLHYFSLGLILGVGYLAKGLKLPLFFVYIVAAAFAGGGFKKPDLSVLATIADFFLISTPCALALSNPVDTPASVSSAVRQVFLRATPERNGWLDCPSPPVSFGRSRLASTMLRGACSVPRSSDRLLRYETHLSREFDRTLAQLERLQRIRLGQPVPPPINLNVTTAKE